MKYEQITNERGFNVPSWWDPINLSTGDFSFHHKNISLKAVMPLEFGLTYHSRDTYDGAVGYGWHHTYEWRLEYRDNGNLYLITPDGAAYLYTPNANGAYTTPAGTYGQLTKLANGTYQLEMPKGLSYFFREDGMLYRIQDPNGNKTQLSYKKTLLMKVETEGASLTFDYLNGGKIATATDQTGRQVVYEYDELNHDLLSVRLPDEGTIRFRYNKKHQLEEIDNPNHTSTLKNTYDDQGRVIHQRDFYGAEGDIQYFPDQHKTVTTDPLSRQKTFEYDERFRQKAIYYPDGTVERFEYDANDNLRTKIDQKGNKWTYLYDANGNLLQTADPLGHTTNVHYNNWNKPDEVTDALGNKTIIGYDDKGNMTSITNPLGETSMIHRDSRGVPTGLENPKKETVVLTNDTSGFVEWIQDPLGNRQHLVRDSLHRVTDAVDALGQITKMEYDARNRVRTRIDALQQREVFDYDKDSNLTYHKDASGAETKVGYEFNRVKFITDALKQTTTFNYDKVGNLIEKIAPNGAKTTYTYNNVNRRDKMIVQDFDEAGNEIQIITEFRYDANGNLTWKKDPNGNITEIHYDERNLPDWIQEPSGAKTAFAYDALGRLERETNALGKSTTYHYDAVGRLDKIKDAMGNETSYEFDQAGRLVKVTRPNGAAWQMQYDARGLLVATTDLLGNTTVLERNELGQVKVSRDATGAATNYSYDKLGRVDSIINALDHGTTISYDPVGRVKGIQDANNHTTGYDYDALGRLKSVTNALNATTMYDYDPVGNITSKIDAMGHITSYKYNMRNKLTQQQNPMDEFTKLGYDANGNLTSILYPDSQTTSYNYDVMNRLTRILYPDNKQVDYTYDELGRRKTMVDSTGTTSYAYDDLNRLTQVTNGANQTIGYEWTSTGQRSKVIYPDGSAVKYGYDLMDRMTSVTDANGATTSYAYDARGLLVSKKLPMQGSSTYQYDALGQVLNIRHANSYDQTVEQLKYAYDPVGNRISSERLTSEHDDHDAHDQNQKDGAHGDEQSDRVITQYAYDALNQLTQVQRYNSNDSQPVTTAYSYDAVGNRLNKQMSFGSHTNSENYTYDAANKLKHWENAFSFKDYTYDQRDNLLKVTGVTRDVREDGEHWNWDWDFGGLVTRAVYGNSVEGNVYQPNVQSNVYGSNDNRVDNWHDHGPTTLEQYTWNTANRLDQQINRQGTVTRFHYDGDGNRVGIAVGQEHDWNNGHNGNENGQQHDNGGDNNHQGYSQSDFRDNWDDKHVTSYSYTNDVSLALPEPLQVLSNGEEHHEDWRKATYVYGPGQERLSVTIPGEFKDDHGNDNDRHRPNTSYYLQDALGSNIGMMDQKGHVFARSQYDEFGIPHEHGDQNMSDKSQLFGYTGLEYDNTTGLNYARARYYKPELGRFISEDTYKGSLWSPQSQNRYTYVENNPLKYIDPSGHLKDYFGAALPIDTDPAKAATNLAQASDNWWYAQKMIDKINNGEFTGTMYNDVDTWEHYQDSMAAWATKQRSVVNINSTIYVKGSLGASLFAGGKVEASIKGDKLTFSFIDGVNGKIATSATFTAGISTTNAVNDANMGPISSNLGGTIGEGLILEGTFKTDGKYVEINYGGGVGYAKEVVLIPIVEGSLEEEHKVEFPLPFNLGGDQGIIPPYEGAPSVQEFDNMFIGRGM